MDDAKQEIGIFSHFLRFSLFMCGVLLVVGLVVVIGSSLNAYNDEGSRPCVWQYDEDTTLEVPYRNHSMPQVYYNAFQDAIDEWDDADTPAEFKFTTSQDNHYLGTEDRPLSNYLGYTSWWCLKPIHKRSSTYAWLNEAKLGAKSSSYKRGVAAHELGHYIGARHSTASVAVMKESPNFNSINRVYEDDECAINDRYEHEDYEVTCD